MDNFDKNFSSALADHLSFPSLVTQDPSKAGGVPDGAGAGGDQSDPQAVQYAQYYAQSYANDPNYNYYYNHFYQQYFVQKAAAESGAVPAGGSGEQSADPYAAYGGYAAGYSTGGGTIYGTSRGGRADEGTPPSRNLWVGGLPMGVQDFELRAAFEHFGAIDQIKTLSTKNVAFVRFVELEAAARAHDSPPGSILVRGLPCRIQWGKHQDEGAGNRGGGGYGDSGGEPVKNLWVGNVDPLAQDFELRALFAPFGDLERVRLVPNKTCAFITFTTLESALAAKQALHGAPFKGMNLKINFGKDSASHQAGGGDRDRDRDRGGGGGFNPFGPNAPTTEYSYQQRPGQAGVTGGSVTRGGGPGGFIPPPGPPDLKTKDVIEKIAAAVSKNAKLEDITKEKQKDNPLFAFLFDNHEWNKFYRWRIFDIKNPGMMPPASLSGGPPPEEDSRPSGGGGGGPAPWEKPSEDTRPPWEREVQAPNYYLDQFQTNEPLGLEGTEKLHEIIATLLPTKESIRNGKDWILIHNKQAKSIAASMKSKAAQAQTFEAKLNILYLINDVLHNAKKKSRASETDTTLDEIASAFLPHIGSIVNIAFISEAPEKQAKLLGLWKEQHVYPQDIINQIEAEMKGNIPPGSAFPAPPQNILQRVRPALQLPPPPSNLTLLQHAQSLAPQGPSGGGGGAPWDQQRPSNETPPPWAQQPPPQQSHGHGHGHGGQYNAVPPPNLGPGVTVVGGNGPSQSGLMSGLDSLFSQAKENVDRRRDYEDDDRYDGSRKRKRSPYYDEEESRSKRYK